MSHTQLTRESLEALLYKSILLCSAYDVELYYMPLTQLFEVVDQHGESMCNTQNKLIAIDTYNNLINKILTK
jgi:hypothetical protein